MTTKTLQAHFRLKCLDPRIEAPLIVDKKKVLIGSNDHCDFRIQDKSVSSYHAFICLKGIDGFMVKDLYSEGGVFINGRRVEESFVNPGDVLTIGTLSFSVDTFDKEVAVVNEDEKIAPVAFQEAVALPPRPGLIFVDGEFCDIEFDESGFVPLSKLPKTKGIGQYIELDQTEESLEIAHNVKAKKLEVVSYMNGMMMDITYLALKDGEYSLTPNKKSRFDILFNSAEASKIFMIKNGELRFYRQEKIQSSISLETVNLSEPLFLTSGTEQISLRFVDSSTRWKGLPFLYRDREFYHQAGKVFATVIMPFILLLFVTIPKHEEVVSEVAIVYKLPEPKKIQPQEPTITQEKSELTAEEVTSKVENTGHKENDQPKEKVQFAKASQPKKVVAKAAAPAAVQAPAAPTPAPVVKSYSFSSSAAMNTLVADAPKINTQGSAAKSSKTDATFNSGSADNGQLVAGADIGVSKFNGSDKTGNGAASYGSRGLAAKKGFDSSYLEPKTVVLGSMDPELLRKILREYIPQFRHCYQQELVGKSDKVKGVIDLNFTIGAEGRVAKHNITAKDARFSQKGITCMGNVLGLIEFPKPKGGGVVDVRQPLNFFAETEKI